eukprot:TRINITY_DN14905_c0_g1_i2.p1 TRINITY_DN14905_c0_g1~~TRINITY_DN14905_c0_g1_i2.p1  ORF type:complete len:294 (+),score=35.80 TRINITY_DN14905_c0_g1_i2:186-1067(+)
MGCVLGCLATSACSCCVGTTCSVMGKALPFSKSMATRSAYAGLFVFVSVLAWIASNWTCKIPEKFMPEPLRECGKEDLCGCQGASAAFRITSSLAVFHLLFAVFLISVKNSRDCRSGVQDAWWGVKILLWVGLCAVSLFLPNEVYAIYAYPSLFGAFLFILVQLVLLVDFAHDWNESWVDNWNEDEDNKGWFYALISSTVFFFLCTIAMTVAMYWIWGSYWFMNVVFITLNLFAIFAFSALSLHPKVQDVNPRIGLLQSSVVSVYATYLLASGLLSQPGGPFQPPVSSAPVVT